LNYIHFIIADAEGKLPDLGTRNQRLSCRDYIQNVCNGTVFYTETQSNHYVHKHVYLYICNCYLERAVHHFKTSQF